MLTLLSHIAVLGESIAREFLVAGQASESTLRSDEEGRDAWLTVQYSQSIAMPYLTGDEQLDAIAGAKDDLLVLQMTEALRPASPPRAQFAVDSKYTDLQTRVLGTLHHAGSELLPESYRLLGNFLGSSEHLVYTQALGIISRGTHEGELGVISKKVIQSLNRTEATQG